MTRRSTPFLILLALLASAAVLLALTPATVEAQCAMCRTAVQAGGEKTAETMKTAMLVLLVPSVTLFCSIFAVILKYRKKDAEAEREEGRDG